MKCGVEISQVTQDIEKVLLYNSTEDIHKMYDMFNVTNYNIDHADFMFFIADTFAMGVQDGKKVYMCYVLQHEWFDLAPI